MKHHHEQVPSQALPRCGLPNPMVASLRGRPGKAHTAWLAVLALKPIDADAERSLATMSFWPSGSIKPRRVKVV